MEGRPPLQQSRLKQYKIAHASLGRLRVVIPQLRDDASFTERLQTLLRSQSRFTQVRINAAARSVTLHYSPDTDAEIYATVAHCIQGACQTEDSVMLVLDRHALSNQPKSGTKETAESWTETLPARIQEIGAGFGGAIAGETVGGAVGTAAGFSLMGPVGAIVGAQVGSFLGFVLGAQIGEEAVIQLNAAQTGAFDVRLQQSLHRRAGDQLGDTVGAAFGSMVGRAMLGPVGGLVGSSVGGAFGGQIGEDTFSRLIPSQKTSDNAPTVTTWMDGTTRAFVGETLTITVSGVVGGLVLGRSGSKLGRKFGTFLGKKMDWSPQPIPSASLLPISVVPPQS